MPLVILLKILHQMGWRYLKVDYLIISVMMKLLWKLHRLVKNAMGPVAAFTKKWGIALCPRKVFFCG